MVTGSESGLVAATLTGAAAMAAATVGFYTHAAAERLLHAPDAVNACVEGRLSALTQAMQQQKEEEMYAHNEMRSSLNMANEKLVHLNKALERAQQPPSGRAQPRCGSTRTDLEKSWDPDTLRVFDEGCDNLWRQRRDTPMHIPLNLPPAARGGGEGALI